MIVATVGPTASGKSTLAVQLAKRFTGEVVNADSRSIYRHLDIGTAKPSDSERLGIRHHLLDIKEIGEPMSVFEFRCFADKAIADIQSRGKLPIIAGGSGLYVDSLLYKYAFPGETNSVPEVALDMASDEELAIKLADLDPEAVARVDMSNRRRVIRAIQTVGQSRTRLRQVRADAIVLGLSMSKELAHQRISDRVKMAIQDGFLEEVGEVGERYGWDSSAFDIIGYRAFKGVALGTKTLDEGERDFVQGDMALYKKQMTWFKRNSEIYWIDAGSREIALAEATQRLISKGLKCSGCPNRVSELADV